MGTKFMILYALCCACAYAYENDTSEDQGPGVKINLKHRRYKSLRDNVTSSSERIALPSIDHPHPIVHDHDYELPVPIKSNRGGLQLQKAPPDLQFGLAFTVPFVSLSTEKLLGSVAGKNYDNPVSSLLKLNFSGLLLAAVVGIAAIAALFLPTVLHGGLGHGGYGSILDNFLPHQFTDNLYNDYNSGWSGDKSQWKQEPWKDGWNGRRNGRAEQTLGNLGAGVLKVFEKLKSGVSNVEKCVVQRVCKEKGSGSGRISKFITGLNNEVVKDVSLYKVVRKVLDGDTAVCGKVEGIELCNQMSGIEENFIEIMKSWGEGEETKDKKKPN